MGRPGGGAIVTRHSHWLPRTGAGRLAVGLFLALVALSQPPVVHLLVDRPEVSVAGLPFLYVYLLAVYTAQVGVLIWAARRGL